MKCDEIIRRLEDQYPLQTAEEWDNPGLLVGRRNREVRKIYVALDATEGTINDAADWGADLIITHHPLLFKGIKTVTDDTFIGRRVITLIENDISYYAMHTNFDILGMAKLNERQLRLEDAHVLSVTSEQDGVEEGIGRIGYLPEEMTLEHAAAFVRESMQVPDVRCYGFEDEIRKNPDMKRMIRKAAVCGGSGRSVVERAIEEGADILITGDIDYHTAIDALARGMFIIDAGHYGTEYCFIEYMTAKLKKLFPELKIKGARIVQPFTVI